LRPTARRHTLPLVSTLAISSNLSSSTPESNIPQQVRRLDMEVTPTFGAIGDFISIVLLVKDIASALDECRGSSKAFRDLIAEIGLLRKALEQVARIYQGPTLPNSFKDLQAIIHTTIDQTRKCLEDFCDRVTKKYGKSLAERGSGSALKDIARKIQWKFEGKETEKFRSEVMGYRMSLEMFLQVTAV
jgi:hypothetical protein